MNEIVRRIRDSKAYSDWVERNRATTCVRCGSLENLSLHHIETISHCLSDHWKFYGDWEEAYQHVLTLHESDMISAATLCDKCHTRTHPGRVPQTIDTTAIDATKWLTAPRTPLPRFAPRKAKHGCLGLISFQVLLGLGNYILQGKIHENLVVAPCGELARILGKKNGTAWRADLGRACETLEQAAIISGHHISNEEAEFFFTQGYLDQLCKNPWFIKITEGHGSSSLAIFLRWFLCFLPNRRRYAIGVDKMAKYLGSDDSNPHRFAARVVEASKQTPWITKAEFRDGLLQFQMKKRATAPVFGLRKILNSRLH